MGQRSSDRRACVHDAVGAESLPLELPPKLPAPIRCMVGTLGPPIVVVPIQEWGKIAQTALQFALTLSPDIRAVHVATEEETNALQRAVGQLSWKPVQRAGRTPPQLITLPSPYRLIIKPILEYVLQIEKDQSGPPNCGDRSGAGRETLVSLSSPQPARGAPESAPAPARQHANRAH